MNDEARVMTGLLCRWTLIVLAIVAVAAACIAGLYATGAVARDMNTVVLPSDAITSSDSKSAHVVPSCTLAIRDQEYYGGLVFTLDDDRIPKLIKYFYAEPDIKSLSPGRHILKFSGLPYGAHAFEDFSAILDVVPPGRKIYLIDTAFIHPQDPAEMSLLSDIVIIAGLKGHVAFIGGKRPDNIRDCRQVVYETLGLYPVILPLEWAKRKETTLEAVRTNIRDTNRLIVLARTPELATESGNCGIATHLAGQSENFPKSTGAVTVHESLSDLRDWFAGRPASAKSDSQPAPASKNSADREVIK